MYRLFTVKSYNVHCDGLKHLLNLKCTNFKDEGEGARGREDDKNTEDERLRFRSKHSLLATARGKLNMHMTNMRERALDTTTAFGDFIVDRTFIT